MRLAYSRRCDSGLSNQRIKPPKRICKRGLTRWRLALPRRIRFDKPTNDQCSPIAGGLRSLHHQRRFNTGKQRRARLGGLGPVAAGQAVIPRSTKNTIGALGQTILKGGHVAKEADHTGHENALNICWIKGTVARQLAVQIGLDQVTVKIDLPHAALGHGLPLQRYLRRAMQEDGRSPMVGKPTPDFIPLIVTVCVQPGADGGGELKRMPVDGPARTVSCHEIDVVLRNAAPGKCREITARRRSVSCRSSLGTDRPSTLAAAAPVIAHSVMTGRGFRYAPSFPDNCLNT